MQERNSAAHPGCGGDCQGAKFKQRAVSRIGKRKRKDSFVGGKATMSTLEREKIFHNRIYAEQGRARMGRIYSIIPKSYGFYEDQLLAFAPKKDVLEYGCGTGSLAFNLAERGARVTGIDISDVAIAEAKEIAERRKLAIDFHYGNAEQLSYGADRFDCICGSGILHHLDLEKAFAEIARTLRPAGRAIFYEPMGHNAIINAYRKRTPNVRSEDEHPLLQSDIARAGEYFGGVEVRYFHFFSLAAIPFHGRFFFRAFLRLLDGMDSLLFRMFPAFQKQAWVAVITLSQPKKTP
jgi:SAM-dependent methyltransferase